MHSWSKLFLLAAAASPLAAATPLTTTDHLDGPRLTLGQPNYTLLTGPHLLSPPTRPLGQLPQKVPEFVKTNTGTLSLGGGTLFVSGTALSFSPAPSEADLRRAESELEAAREKYENALKKLKKLQADREATLQRKRELDETRPASPK